MDLGIFCSSQRNNFYKKNKIKIKKIQKLYNIVLLFIVCVLLENDSNSILFSVEKICKYG